jgi:hypothetical protein
MLHFPSCSSDVWNCAGLSFTFRSEKFYLYRKEKRRKTQKEISNRNPGREIKGGIVLSHEINNGGLSPIELSLSVTRSVPRLQSRR